MKKIQMSEIKNLFEYEKERETLRARVIALKQNRRVSVGDNLTFLFENRETVLFQIQEMVRTERIADDAKIREEVDAYNALIPDAGELSATLFIEIPDLHRMNHAQVREAVNRFQGIDREGVTLRIGDRLAIPARFEEGHSKEEKMAAVHYVRFAVPAEGATLLAEGAGLSIAVDHPNYEATTALRREVRAELLRDLELAPATA